VASFFDNTNFCSHDPIIGQLDNCQAVLIRSYRQQNFTYCRFVMQKINLIRNVWPSGRSANC